jgi:hypothetical protein
MSRGAVRQRWGSRRVPDWTPITAFPLRRTVAGDSGAQA